MGFGSFRLWPISRVHNATRYFRNRPSTDILRLDISTVRKLHASVKANGCNQPIGDTQAYYLSVHRWFEKQRPNAARFG